MKQEGKRGEKEEGIELGSILLNTTRNSKKPRPTKRDKASGTVVLFLNPCQYVQMASHGQSPPKKQSQEISKEWHLPKMEQKSIELSMQEKLKRKMVLRNPLTSELWAKNKTQTAHWFQPRSRFMSSLLLKKQICKRLLNKYMKSSILMKITMKFSKKSSKTQSRNPYQVTSMPK